MLVKEQDLEVVEALAAPVDFVPANPQYNHRCVRNYENSSQYILASAKMEAMSTLCREMIGSGVPLHIFCRAL